MQDLDKAALGQRIRRIRAQAKLRQWELARMLGTTQSAVHKYEHGVIPEPRRLIELARIGNTSIEWILTGHHWDNGSAEQPRPTPDLLETACALRDIDRDERASIDEALRIMREAARAVAPKEPVAPEGGTIGPSAVRDLAPETLKLLEAAWRIERAVVRWVTEGAATRLASSTLLAENGAPATEGKPRRS